MEPDDSQTRLLNFVRRKLADFDNTVIILTYGVGNKSKL